MVSPGFRTRAWQYQIGMVWTYFGMTMYIIAFVTPAWYLTVDLAPDGNGYRRLIAGLWQICEMGFQRCLNIPSPVANWMITTRIFQTAGLVLYIMSGVLTTVQILLPRLSFKPWAQTLEFQLLTAGVISFTSVLVFGTYVQEVSPNKEMSWGYMLAIVSSLSALASFINIFQGRFDTDDDTDGGVKFANVHTGSGYPCGGMCGNSGGDERGGLGEREKIALQSGKQEEVEESEIGDVGVGVGVAVAAKATSPVADVQRSTAKELQIPGTEAADFNCVNAVGGYGAQTARNFEERRAELNDLAAANGVNECAIVEVHDAVNASGYDEETPRSETGEDYQLAKETRKGKALKAKSTRILKNTSLEDTRKTVGRSDDIMIKRPREKSSEDAASSGHKVVIVESDETASPIRFQRFQSDVSDEDNDTADEFNFADFMHRTRYGGSSATLVHAHSSRVSSSERKSPAEPAREASEVRATSLSSDRDHSEGDQPSEVGITEAEKIAYYEGGDVPADETEGKPASAEALEPGERESFLEASA